MTDIKPLRDIHLQPSIHVSKVSVGSATLNMVTLRSFRDYTPKATNENDVDVRAAAAMCQYAYYTLNQGKKPKAELIDGWKPMTSIEVDRLIAPGFHMKLRRDSCGFNSMLFQKQVDDIKYYAYCTEGTDMTSVKDWFSNVTQGLVGLSPQYTYSVLMAKTIDRAIGNRAALWFVGHSLGGGLASNNSLVTGRHAITFNAAGLNFWREQATLLLNNRDDLFQYNRRTQRIHAFVLEGEILNSILRWIGQPAYGNRTTMRYDQSNKSRTQRHAMTTVLDHMGMRHDRG